MGLLVICLLIITLQFQFSIYKCDKQAAVMLNDNNNNERVAAKKHVPPVIAVYEDFDRELKGFLEKNEQLTMLFDFDGTLAQLTVDPSVTTLTPYTIDILTKLAKNPKIEIGLISGRGLGDLKSRVPIPNITLSGNHGIEIENPDGTRSDFQLPDGVQKRYKELLAELTEAVGKNGGYVEDKIFSLTYHYEHVPEEFVEMQFDECIRIIEKYGFIANTGSLAIEAKPPVDWNKGKATSFILQKNFGDDWLTKTKVIFAGDEATDEDAMKELQGVGVSKTFRISKDPKLETYADFKLPSQSMVPELLRWIDSHYSQ